ncbi:RNA polymerase sigma factor [Nevskia ramosa]|uniref:RNA polymerase sigma factor n=1 Tax=Nevskia ramosa TaxID=64002 RepID=UPI0003B6495B|nr:RNA polymerase sigma factor [Nevskia ramosa]
MSTGPSDEQLMQRYRDGDASAFEPLYRRHRDGVYRYLLRGCSRSELAGELFQEVWIGVVRARTDWQPRARFATWLYRIAHNRLIDTWRSTPQGHESLPDESDEDGGTSIPPALWAPLQERPEEQQLASERGVRLRKALATLPREQRDAFLLHEESGMSLDEIAEASGVGRETIKSRLRYALAKLREALADV